MLLSDFYSGLIKLPKSFCPSLLVTYIELLGVQKSGIEKRTPEQNLNSISQRKSALSSAG
jgi:hypothetical protein